MSKVTISNPQLNQVIPLGVAFLVSGTAEGIGMPEPDAIESVTVQVDNGPLQVAELHPAKKPKPESPPAVTFEAKARLTGAAGQHTITVTAALEEHGGKISSRVTVQTPPHLGIGPTKLVATTTNEAGDLHVLVIDEHDGLWHTIRLADGEWPFPWGNVQQEVP